MIWGKFIVIILWFCIFCLRYWRICFILLNCFCPCFSCSFYFFSCWFFFNLWFFLKDVKQFLFIGLVGWMININRNCHLQWPNLEFNVCVLALKFMGVIFSWSYEWKDRVVVKTYIWAVIFLQTTIELFESLTK